MTDINHIFSIYYMVIWFIKVDGNKIQHGKISVGFGYRKLFISTFQLLQRIRYR